MNRGGWGYRRFRILKREKGDGKRGMNGEKSGKTLGRSEGRRGMEELEGRSGDEEEKEIDGLGWVVWEMRAIWR